MKNWRNAPDLAARILLRRLRETEPKGGAAKLMLDALTREWELLK